MLRAPVARSRTEPLAIDRVVPIDELTLHDLESVRILLRGGSVIDWFRLDFENHGQVDRFLRVNEFDPESADDMDRFERLRIEAVDYLSRNFQLRIPDDIAEHIPARDLLLVASRKGRRQTLACVVLKVMHIVQHLAGREAALELPISDDQMFRAVELKVMRIVEELRAAGYPIYEFQWSRKPSDSLITKLLAKRSTLAANIYDKLRFRLIVREHTDLVPMIAVLTRRLIPFNYVVPGQSVNHLVPFRQLIHDNEALRRYEQQLKGDIALEKKQDLRAAGPLNEFSGREYKIINFVADIPLRVEAITGERPPLDHCHVVFVLTEFQIADQQTAHNNETGENSHDAYKARQHRRVRQRLMRGSKTQPTGPIPVPSVSDADVDTEGDGSD